MAMTLVLLSGCTRTDSPNTPPEAGDVAVARIDGQTVWASDVRLEAVAQGYIGEGEPLDITSDLFQRTLDDVIYRKLMAKEARQQGLDKGAAARRRVIAAEDRILADMLVENTLEGAIDENKVRQLYNQQVEQSKGAEDIRARMILVATRAEAEALIKRLNSGAEFEALAREHSLDHTTRQNGGDLGYVSSDLMPQALKGSLSGAAVGQVIGPVETESGFVIVRIEDRRPEVPLTYEESRPQIVRFLTFDQLRALLTTLRKAARIEMLIPGLKESEPDPAEPGAAPLPPPADSANTGRA